MRGQVATHKLGYGVMVTLQILVLPFLVRVRVSQLSEVVVQEKTTSCYDRILHKLLIGIWCNGNTADSGPAFPGSSPGIPTEHKAFILRKMDAFFMQ